MAGTMILFLDFDGVLHEDPCFDEARLFECAPGLAQALEPFPEVRIVLSTSWRTDRTLAEMCSPCRKRCAGG
jgi:histidinol phosphatase-like enzyme